jgi:hypothetical protein
MQLLILRGKHVSRSRAVGRVVEPAGACSQQTSKRGWRGTVPTTRAAKVRQPWKQRRPGRLVARQEQARKWSNLSGTLSGRIYKNRGLRTRGGVDRDRFSRFGARQGRRDLLPI